MQEIIKKIPTTLIALLVFYIFIADSYAADTKNNVFTINNILVDETADNSEEARKRAVLSGEIRAFNQLLSSLVLAMDLQKIPDVTRAEIVEAVQGFEVNDEKISNTRYSATLTISFYKDVISKILSREGINLVEKKSPSVLVIPIFEENNKYVLWNSKSDWYKSWNNVAANSSKISIILPLIDLEDMKRVKIEDVLSGDYTILKTLGERYKTKYIVISEARYKDGGSLEVIFKPVGDSKIPEQKANYKIFSAEDRRGSFESSIRDILARVENSWDYKNDILYNSIYVNINFSNLDEWILLKEKIDDIENIKTMDVEKINTDGAYVYMYYENNLSKIINNLKSAEIELYRVDDVWKMKRNK